MAKDFINPVYHKDYPSTEKTRMAHYGTKSIAGNTASTRAVYQPLLDKVLPLPHTLSKKDKGL